SKMQFPKPSQAEGFVWVVPVQLAGMEPQAVLLVGKEQAPKVVSQSVAPQGGVTSVQAAAQQLPTPVTPQTPLSQALFEKHAPWKSLGSQAPASTLQYPSDAQWLSSLQLAKQALVSQVKGSQACCSAGQCPSPSQVTLGLSCTPLLQVSVPPGPQTTVLPG